MRRRFRSTTAHELARELGVPEYELAVWLLRTFPYSVEQPSRAWVLSRRQAREARRHFRGSRRLRLAPVLATLVATLAIVGAGIAAAGYWQAEAYVAELQAGEKRAVVVAARQELDVAPRRPAVSRGPGEARTVLLVGSDARWGSRANRRSDTMILARVDPADSRIALLSIPRDVLVDIPGRGRDRVNEAYKHGGVALLAKTLREELGVEINHFFAVDMGGFRRVVSTLGGVYLPIDGRYFNRNLGTPGTNYAEIDLRPGYQLLDGEQALSYVRFRHADSDFARAARQQLFLRETARQVVESRFDVLKLRRIIQGVAEATTSDIDDLGALWGLLRAVEETPSSRVARFTLPAREAVIGGAFYLTTDPRHVRRTVTQWYGGGQALRRAPAQQSGRAAPQRRAAAAPPRLVFPDGGRGARLAEAVRRVRLCRPTALPRGYWWPESDVVHAYRLGGKPAAALWATRGSGRSVVWTATTWSEVPALRQPTSTVERGGRTYDLWFENRRLRQVAWKRGDVRVWITNTLRNELSIEQMLQLADSCR